MMDDKPRVRPIEAFPVQQDGKTLIYLKDPLNLATPHGHLAGGIFRPGAFRRPTFLHRYSRSLCKQFGSLLMSDDLKSFVDMLDQHYYLESERFEEYQKAVVLEFRRQPTRAPAHVGGVYKADPRRIEDSTRRIFQRRERSGTARWRNSPASTPKAIVAPHIDFHRGGPAYAWAYKPLAESDGADLYILLGTSHCSGQTPYILTLKDFDNSARFRRNRSRVRPALAGEMRRRLFCR